MYITINIVNESNFGFLVSNIILSKENDFSHDEILKDIGKYQFDADLDIHYQLRKALNNLCENGLIKEYASMYSVEKR